MDRLPSRKDLSRRAGWCSGAAVLWLLLAGLASPAAAEETAARDRSLAKSWALGLKSSAGPLKHGLFSRLSGGPAPWSVAAPGAAGARFGLGLDAFFEHQESLRIAGMESVLTVRHLASGNEHSEVLHGDPGLLNRKFDIVWEMTGAGVEVPIALSPRGSFAHSTLVLRAATADTSLDFQDRNRPQDSNSLEGRGALLGAEVNVVSALCKSCPWYTEASYGFQTIPSFTVDRSPRFRPEGFEVLEDEVRLDREVQEVAARIGYGFPNNRVTAYTGVLHWWTDLNIEDELRYRDPLRITETRLSSRTNLESEATLGIAGVDYRIGSRLFGRLETSLGGGDWVVTVNVVHLGLRDETEEERREEELAADIAKKLRLIHTDFLEAFDGLPEVVPLATVEELLRRTEERVLAVFPFPEFAATQDYFRAVFLRIRDTLNKVVSVSSAVYLTGDSRSRVLLDEFGSNTSVLSGLALAAEERPRKADFLGIASFLSSVMTTVIIRAENNDLKVDLCVMTEPVEGAMVVIHPVSYKRGKDEFKTNSTRRNKARGLYAYEQVALAGYRTIPPCSDFTCVLLNLMDSDRPFVRCFLTEGPEAMKEGSCIVEDNLSGESRCEANKP